MTQLAHALQQHLHQRRGYGAGSDSITDGNH
jgi:hypothetical protein